MRRICYRSVYVGNIRNTNIRRIIGASISFVSINRDFRRCIFKIVDRVGVLATRFVVPSSRTRHAHRAYIAVSPSVREIRHVVNHTAVLWNRTRVAFFLFEFLRYDCFPEWSELFRAVLDSEERAVPTAVARLLRY